MTGQWSVATPIPKAKTKTADAIVKVSWERRAIPTVLHLRNGGENPHQERVSINRTKQFRTYRRYEIGESLESVKMLI